VASFYPVHQRCISLLNQQSISDNITGKWRTEFTLFLTFFKTVGSCPAYEALPLTVSKCCSLGSLTFSITCYNLKLFSCTDTVFKQIFQVKWKEINDSVIFHDVIIICADEGLWYCMSLILLHPVGLQSLKYLLSSPSLKKFADPLYTMTYERIFKNLILKSKYFNDMNIFWSAYHLVNSNSCLCCSKCHHQKLNHARHFNKPCPKASALRIHKALEAPCPTCS